MQSIPEPAAYGVPDSLLPPSGGPACFVCGQCPKENQDFPRCAKCKIIVYCSKKCQKPDWPTHKMWCSETNMQRDFVLKCFGRVHLNREFMRNVEMTLAEGFFDSFTRSSFTNEISKKMWVFDVNMFLSPIKDECLEPFDSLDIKSGALDMSMVAELMASKFTDISDREKFSASVDARVMWQKHRDSLDNCNLKESIAIVVKFKYLGAQFYIVPCTILPQDLADVKERREMAKNGESDFPDSVRHIDRWLRNLKDNKGKKAVCLMGSRDKGWLLVGAAGSGLEINVKVRGNRFGL